MGVIVRMRAADIRRHFAARVGRTVSIAEVARSVGVTRAALGRIEHNQSWVSAKVLAGLCEFYGVQPGDMIELVEDEPVEGGAGEGGKA